jgi:hypothetical protein
MDVKNARSLALAALLTLAFATAGCATRANVGGDEGVGYEGKLFKDGKVISVETDKGDPTE